MAKVADIGSKRLVGLAPDRWVQWVTQQDTLIATEVVESEFQWVSRDTDVLVKVHSPDLGDLLVLTEFQLRIDPRMPRRMRAYAGLAEERYACLVYPVLVNLLPPPGTNPIPDRYESTVLGLAARQDYRVINLWELDADLVFQESLPTLLPFVPLFRGGNDETIIRRALQELRADAPLRDMESLLAFFATFVLERAAVQEIMRWDMAVLRESPWYQEILQEGEARGRAEGEALGRLEGQRREAIAILLKLLPRQFAIDRPQWRDRLETLSLEQLEALVDAQFDFATEADLEAWFSQQ